MVQKTLVDLLEREDFEKLRTVASVDSSEESVSLLRYLKQNMSTNVGTKRHTSNSDMIVTETETVPIDRMSFDAHGGDVGGTHGLTFNFERYLESLRDSAAFEDIRRRTRCSGCKQLPQDPMVIECHHVYCRHCLKDLRASYIRRGLEQARCIGCGSIFDEARPCAKEIEEYLVDQELETGASDGSSTAGSSVGSKKKKAPELENWLYMRGEVLPSAKSVALKAQIMAWVAEDPSVKIIVYSQFLAMINLLHRICMTEEWTAERYTGSMSHDNREKALASFGDPEKGVRILLASLRSGGIGLNLTMASRVICLDPWVCSIKPRGHQHDGLLTSSAVELFDRTASILPRLSYRPGERDLHDATCGQEHNRRSHRGFAGF